MDPVDNNQFEIIPSTKAKRKIAVSCPTAYLNPALDLLANEDPMINTAMEIVPNKKRKRARSCDITAFENTALDLGITKAAVNEFLSKELENVRKNVKINSVPDLVESAKPKITSTSHNKADYYKETVNDNNTSDNGKDIDKMANDTKTEPIYANINVADAEEIRDLNSSVSTDSALSKELSSYSINADLPEVVTATNEAVDTDVSMIDIADENIINMENTLKNESLRAVNMPHPIFETGDLSSILNIQSNVTNNIFVNNQTNLSLSFIDKLALDSPNVSSQSLFLDDDLNESNIMEIKTITIITKKKKVPEKKKNTNPFLSDSPTEPVVLSITENPFLNTETTVNSTDLVYEPQPKQFETQINHDIANLAPRRLFDGEINSTVSTANDTSATYAETHEYENVDSYRVESPVYENIGDIEIADLHDYENIPDTSYNINKQSKILGYDVSKFSAVDIMNLNKNTTLVNCSNDSNDSKKDLKHQILKASNKLSKKVFKTLKKTFKHEHKTDNNVSLNPYEVPRKAVKKKPLEPEGVGIENPALNLDNSNETDLEEEDEEHQYETIKTIRNTKLNMNVTPLKERNYDTVDCSNSYSTKLTPSKKVRFDSTLNQEKVITGNSFDYGIASPGFDAKIDKYQDELENCINEKKFIQQLN